jgi:hypothetical protein
MFSNILAKSYHQSTSNKRKTKLNAVNGNNEDELLNFFLYGSYEVQHGDSQIFSSQNNDKTPIGNLINNDKKTKSRCMFEETYMINVSVKQPDTIQNEKQFDVRIEKSPSNIQIRNKNIEEDEVIPIDINHKYNGNINQHNQAESRKLRIEKLTTLQTPSLATDIKDDEKLFHYLNYLETNHSITPLKSVVKAKFYFTSI